MNSYSKNTSGVSSLQDGMGQLSVTDKEKENTLNYANTKVRGSNPGLHRLLIFMV